MHHVIRSPEVSILWLYAGSGTRRRFVIWSAGRIDNGHAFEQPHEVFTLAHLCPGEQLPPARAYVHDPIAQGQRLAFQQVIA